MRTQMVSLIAAPIKRFQAQTPCFVRQAAKKTKKAPFEIKGKLLSDALYDYWKRMSIQKV